MTPAHDGIASYGFNEFIPAFFVIVPAEFFGKIKVVPTNNGVFDESTAAFRNLLVFFFALAERVVVAQ
jgi:hypothetical protein